MISDIDSNDTEENGKQKSELLKGEDIDYFYAIGSMYNNGCVGVVSGKNNYSLRVEEFNKIKDRLRFKIDLASNSGDRRRTHDYLEIVER